MKALDPILRKKYYAKMLKGQEILQTLDKHGFFDDNLKRGRDKQGKLYIKHHVDGTWTKYTVILKGPYLYYYSRGNVRLPPSHLLQLILSLSLSLF